jgi:[ribosomal protein S5]-alanine N-acetyltransferase
MSDQLPDDLFAIDVSKLKLPPYAEFPVLSFENIVLREMIEIDMTALLPILSYNGKHAKTLEKAMDVLHKTAEDYQKGEGINWAITDKKTGALLGTCGYYRKFDEATGEIGCILLPEYEGKGIMRKALRLIVAFGLETIVLQRIIAITKTSNKRAIKMLHAIDFIEVADLEDDKIAYEYFG